MGDESTTCEGLGRVAAMLDDVVYRDQQVPLSRDTTLLRSLLPGNHTQHRTFNYAYAGPTVKKHCNHSNAYTIRLGLVRNTNNFVKNAFQSL